MANMFKEASNYKSPASVEDSVKTDKIIDGLWRWCYGIERLGMILFIIIIIIGIVTSIFAGIEQESVSYFGEINYTFNFVKFLTSLLSSAIGAFIEYCIYHAVALLMGALASITQHTKATAKLLEYQLTKSKTTENNGCQSEKCMGENSDYTGAGSYRNTKAGGAKAGAGNTARQRVCKNCGTVISEDACFCRACGTKQTEKVYR